VARFQYATIADVGLCRFQASGFYRSAPIGSKHRGPHCAVILQLKEKVHYELNGQMAILLPRHWIAVDQGDPASVFGPEGTDSLIVMVPWAKLVEERAALERAAMRPFSGDVGLGNMAWTLIRSAFASLSNLQPQFESGVRDMICQSIRLAIMEYTGQQDECSQQRLLRERIKAYILTHLRDPELNADRIAAELKCTKRYLHKVFELEDISICDYIRNLRLDRCRQEIVAPGCHKSVTDIGFSWGFNSSPHFSAIFKKHFGSCPSSYRKKELPANAECDRNLRLVKAEHRDALH
jgi:AraC-like DNA-binding protein